MRHNRNIIEGVKDYLWGDGLDFWNTPRHEVHDYPLTNPLQDFSIWGTQGGHVAFARYHLDKFMSGDYDSFIKDTISHIPINRRRYRPAVSTATYKSSGSSSRAYQQNGSPGGTSKGSGSMDWKANSNPWAMYQPKWVFGIGYSCKPGYKLQKVKGKWMCVRTSRKNL